MVFRNLWMTPWLFSRPFFMLSVDLLTILVTQMPNFEAQFVSNLTMNNGQTPIFSNTHWCLNYLPKFGHCTPRRTSKGTYIINNNNLTEIIFERNPDHE